MDEQKRRRSPKTPNNPPTKALTDMPPKAQRKRQTQPKTEGPHSQTGRKLSPANQAKMFEKIIAGCTNAEINGYLRSIGALGADDSLSYETLRKYRHDPRAKVDITLLTLEARQAGHAALSAIIVRAASLNRAAAEAMIADDLRIALKMSKDGSGLSAQQLASLNSVFANTAKIIIDNLAPDLAQLITAEDALAAQGDVVAPHDAVGHAYDRLRNLAASELEKLVDDLEAQFDAKK